ncbi:MAG: type I-E CRISPR-associated endonuclease Cas1e [Chloroflexota bacterium]|nr:type I-E CRISPR-associated endonuclease Cas1e [Chloroflexota bacterium]
MQNLHELPKLRDSLSYLYIEHAVIERRDNALLVLQETGRTPVPVANLCVLLLGPGTSMTHAAVSVCGGNGCSIVWCGQDGTHFYAQGTGETRKSRHLLHQAKMVSDPVKRTNVVKKMYEKRFGHKLDPDLSIDQVRGLEGSRMRTAYQLASKAFGVEWHGRNYDRKNWHNSDPINRAISAANAVLYGVCHAGIVSGGYSPGLGFLHTGWQLSFVYDIADLYKTELSIPVAFETAAEDKLNISSRTRQACRERIRETRLLHRILPDIDELLDVKTPEDGIEFTSDDFSLSDYWWQPQINSQVEDV